MNNTAAENSGQAARTGRGNAVLLGIVTLGILVALAYYLYVNADRYITLMRLSTAGLIWLVLIGLMLTFFNGLINTYAVRGLGANLSHPEGFLLAAVTTLANQLPVSGGIAAKGYYLKHRYQVPYAKYFSSMGAILFCSLAVYGLLGLVILLDWAIFDQIQVAPILFFGFGGMMAGILVFALPVEKMGGLPALRRWQSQMQEGWSLVSRNRALLLRLILLQIIAMLLIAVRYWLAFHMLSQDVSFEQVVLISCASALTQLVSFAPGGLGVREAIVGSLAAALGFDPAVSVAAVGLDRAVATLVIVITGWTATLILRHRYSGMAARPGPQPGS